MGDDHLGLVGTLKLECDVDRAGRPDVHGDNVAVDDVRGRIQRQRRAPEGLGVELLHAPDLGAGVDAARHRIGDDARGAAAEAAARPEVVGRGVVLEIDDGVGDGLAAAGPLEHADVVDQHGLRPDLVAVGWLVVAAERAAHGDVQDQEELPQELFHGVGIDGPREVRDAIDLGDDAVFVPVGLEDLVVVAEGRREAAVLGEEHPAVREGAGLRCLEGLVAPVHGGVRRPIVGEGVVHLHEIDLAGAGPRRVREHGAEGPERRPGAVADRRLDARYDGAVPELELVLGGDSGRSDGAVADAAGLDVTARLDDQVAVLDADVVRRIGIELPLVVAPAVVVGAVAGLDVPELGRRSIAFLEFVRERQLVGDAVPHGREARENPVEGIRATEGCIRLEEVELRGRLADDLGTGPHHGSNDQLHLLGEVLAGEVEGQALRCSRGACADGDAVGRVAVLVDALQKDQLVEGRLVNGSVAAGELDGGNELPGDGRAEVDATDLEVDFLEAPVLEFTCAVGNARLPAGAGP